MNRRNLLIGSGGAWVLAGAGAGAWVSTTGTMSSYATYATQLRASAPAQPQPGDLNLIRHATLAANSHNTQPWLFRVSQQSIEILPDPARRTPVVDPDDHHLFVSLGCAAENLTIAGGALGQPGEILFDIDGGGARFIHAAGPDRADPLFQSIPVRQSTRAAYDGRRVSAADLAYLERAAAMPGVQLILLTDTARMRQVRDLVVAGNSTQLADPAFMRELKQWLRFNPQSAIRRGDGLFAPASGNPSLPDCLGPTAVDLLFRAGTENDKYARHIDSSAGLAIFVGALADKQHWMQVGRACQRFALAATHLGLRHAFVNQPVEVAALRPELAGLIGEPDKRPDLVLRFGYGPTLPYSPRRPVDAVLLAPRG